MRVLAIDPGTYSLGWASMQKKEDGKITIGHFYGALQFERSEPMIDRLNSIYMVFYKNVSNRPYDLLMLEKTFKVDRNTIALAASIQIIKQAADACDMSVRQENAMRVRAKFHCGSRTSEVAKEKVKAYVLERFPQIPDNLVQDVYDAILLGCYALETE